MMGKYNYLNILIGSFFAVLSLAACSGDSESTSGDEKDPWDAVAAIEGRIVKPTFRDKDYPITDFGAIDGGKTDCTLAFRTAIETCNKEGGGRVVVPAGNYLTGAIHLLSNVNLHLEKGATILFSTKPSDYLPLVHTRWEGVELMGYSPLIYAFEQKNIAITGEGTLDGQANETNWWPWKGNEHYGFKPGSPSQLDKDKRAALFGMAEQGVPVADRKFGEGSYLRPQFVQPYRCENVLIEGVTLVNSPMWLLNPVLCTNVTIDGVTMTSNGPNNDGCDPESCKDVLIKNCYFNTGDDCIAIKSGRNADGRRLNVPSENILIENCNMANGHGGVVIGSEVSGGVRNVFARNCQMNSPELDRALRIKTNTARGGTIENIYMKDIEVGQVKEQTIIATMMYEDTGSYMPTIRNIEVRNMTVKQGGKTGILLQGYEESPITNVRLNNVTINGVKVPYEFNHASDISSKNLTINGKETQFDQ
ncbi:glycoside hydrolase family 28 protein [Persicitalea jodogahamensis]|uniref:Glycoside hydrolase n=1 Tax=Persicitalea jodogahamensis TaxID=402147 RepID=A0A8J3DBB8_9BACT|nr:glycoside hydrolase family 28 protein [Persicitalea jodogahamensis]GHB79713.1 glycoside hydrolase [Persicitalea jodogahamensis]